MWRISGIHVLKKTTTLWEITWLCYAGHEPSYATKTWKTDLERAAYKRAQTHSYYQDSRKWTAPKFRSNQSSWFTFVIMQCEFVAQSLNDALNNCSGKKHFFLIVMRRNTCFNSLEKLCIFFCLLGRNTCQLLFQHYMNVIYKFPYCKFKQLHSDYTQKVMFHIYTDTYQ
jgi:hypothetical protein